MEAHPTAMACPACRTGLVMSERQGIEIDYCPACRGVWLDRGELDKIIERSAAEFAPVPKAASKQPSSPWSGDPRYRHDGDHRPHGHRKDRKSTRPHSPPPYPP